MSLIRFGVVGQPERPDGAKSFSVPLVVSPGVHADYFGAVFGRLKPGVTVAQAQADVALAAKRHAVERHDIDERKYFLSVELLKNDWLDHTLARNLWLLLAAVGFVLLIACADVANLLLARGAARQQELAVRSALGATRRQMFVQLITESLSLAVLGGIVGVALGWALMKTSMKLLPNFSSAVENVVQVDTAVLCFSVAVSVLAGVLFDCIPAWKAARVNLSETLKQGSRSATGRGRWRIQGMLVTGEFALALTLLAGAGMVLHSFWNLSNIDLGVTTRHVLSIDIRDHATRKTAPSAEETVAFQRHLLEQLRAVPGVADAALATNAPLHGHNSYPFSIAGEPDDRAHRPAADLVAATPGLFSTLGIRLARGRFLQESDTMTSTLAVMVNESFVRHYLSRGDALGQRLMLMRPVSGQHTASSPAAFQIIGVYHDVLNDEHLTGETGPQMMISLWQAPLTYAGIIVRTSVDPAVATADIRSTIANIAPQLSIEFHDMREIVTTQLTSDRFGSVLFGAFACLALVLAGLGIYGVISFAVAQRRHEMGIRIALGAQRGDVVGLIVRGGIRMAAPGMAIGLAGVWVLGRLMHSTLYGVGSVDYVSFALVAMLLLAVALCACWIPARRCARVDPMMALRDE
jgi:putative ABC transport system permease protein